MQKKTVEKVAKILPKALKNARSYFKESSVIGVIELGLLIEFFGQDKIDAYFKEVTKNKLADYGSNIYLQASLLQVGKSMKTLNQEAIQVENAKSIVEHLALFLDEASFDPNDILTIFTPQYHPIVLFVKEQMEKLLDVLELHPQVIQSFTRDFNKNIEATLKETFGDEDYAKHLEEIKEFVLEESESKLLHDMYELRKIGFKDGESLRYEEAYASWKPVSSVLGKEEEVRPNRDKEKEQKEHQELEANLKPTQELIEEYFESYKESVQNILFVIADFGKGKTVFLKQYASRLAKEYAQTQEGYFPIYFNLRNFSNYSSDGTLGVLGHFLLDEYGIRIDDEEFKKKKYLFLVDSLDESGELTQGKIDRVVESIKNIQNIDKETRRDNRIVISSRPFSEALESQLKAHKPLTKLDENSNKIPQYISLYGFKEEQFNAWLSHTLESEASAPNNEKSFENMYQELLEQKTLSRTELRRPIFAYMIYQLILNKIDFLAIGKIGVYLSFINLLTKEAKHIDDKNHTVNHKDEIYYRNILHSISALWMYERQQGKQGILKKADICRVLDGENKQESDKEILTRYKEEGVTEIEFLSHSYFGEEDNNLHFQHQSFAEILLAEYYLKVFIKYAIDKQPNVEMARSKLILGEPTEQTVEFFKELLHLLKDTVSDELTDEVLEKRKLLYPLMATLANDRHNRLYCERIDSKWFEDVEIDNNSSTIHPDLLENWAIKSKELEQIIELAREIIDSKTTLLLAKTENRTALFDKELTLFQNAQVSDSPTDMDKWLALVVGNLLHDDKPEERDFFNGRLENPENLFEMIKGWNYSMRDSAPRWGKECFKGIMMKQSVEINLINYSFDSLDFSYSTFKNINMTGANLGNSCFDNCNFTNIGMIGVCFGNTSFKNLENISNIDISYSCWSIYLPAPTGLVFSLGSTILNKEQTYPKTFVCEWNSWILESLLEGFITYGLKNNLFDIPEIKSWFDYEREEDREVFEGLIDGLEEFDIK